MPKTFHEKLLDLFHQKKWECQTSGVLRPNGFYEMRCEHGHFWEEAGYLLMHRHACPICQQFAIMPMEKKGGKKLGELDPNSISYRKRVDCFNLVSEKIADQGGELLIEKAEFPTTLDNVPVKCSFGHIWHPQINNLMYGSWCPTCAKHKLYKNKLENKPIIHDLSFCGLTKKY